MALPPTRRVATHLRKAYTAASAARLWAPAISIAMPASPRLRSVEAECLAFTNEGLVPVSLERSDALRPRLGRWGVSLLNSESLYIEGSERPTLLDHVGVEFRQCQVNEAVSKRVGASRAYFMTSEPPRGWPKPLASRQNVR